MKSAPDERPVRRSVTYGDERIEFALSRRHRKTLAITVHPDLRVEVVAPMNAAETAILERVRHRARWILRQQRQFLSWMPKPRDRQYRGGETHRYLGRQYRLKLVRAKASSVKLRGGFLEVGLPDPADPKAVRRVLDRWYRDQSKVRFAKQLREAHARMKAHEIPEPRLRLLRMAKRWGSCTPAGEILLNPDLVKAPAPCIDYVILHELCHLKHPNHSRAFFELLDAILPEWRKQKDRLERVEI
ncbi:MAG: M48 family metallopeptidase [Verrucomicrobiales bacterium]|nr:M48 family metallopeptidase [Verrucomicrobiales bacterium]